MKGCRNADPGDEVNELKFIKIEEQGGKGCLSCNNSEDKSNPPEWVAGIIETPVGKVRGTKTEWSLADHWGQIKCRMSGFRMKYTIAPGLYAVGCPDKDSD